MSLFDRGDDGFKGACHGAMLVLAVLSTAYNWIAYRRRPSPILAVNTAFYGAVAVVEVGQILKHVKGEY